MPLQQSENVYHLFTAVRHEGPYSANDVAKGAYVVIVKHRETLRCLWGRGTFRNSQTMMAEGVREALFCILNDNPDALEDGGPAFEAVIYGQAGQALAEYLDCYIVAWMANNGRKRDGSVPEAWPTWKSLYELYHLGKVRFKSPELPAEHDLVKRAKKLSKQYAMDATKAPKGAEGVRESGDYEMSD